MWTARYRSAVDFNRRRSIEGEKGKKKKKRKRRKKKKGEEEPTFHMPSSLAGRPRTVTALTLSPPSPAGAFSPVRGDRTSPYAGRKIEVTLREDKFLILPKVIDFLTEILDHIVSVIEDKCNEMSCDGSVNLSFILDSAGTNASSLRSLLASPLFKLKDGTDCVPLARITQAIEKLLVAFAKLFDVLSKFPTDPVSDTEIQQLPISSVDPPQDSMAEFNVRIVDMELDVDESFEDMDSVAMSGGKRLITSPFLNFGFKMVRASKDLTIKAEDIVAAGLQPALAVETALITLAHLALASEEVEIEVLAVGI
ncbi:hypothetical protein BHE74_00015584 [Ensete ventricosum]|nr:hypothetical protein BHE74_00015584 [Ensete ventricosum]